MRVIAVALVLLLTCRQSLAALSLTFIANVSSDANGTVYDFGNVTVPTDGLLIVVAGSSAGSGTRSVSSMTLGGSAATLHATSTADLTTCGIGSRVVSAGDQNVTVTFSTSGNRAAAAAYVLTGYASATPSDFDATSGPTGTSTALTVDYAAGDIGVYGHFKGGTNAMSWSAATEESEITVESASQWASAHKATTGTGDTETISWTSNAGRAGAVAVWQPSGGGGGSAVPVIFHNWQTH